MTLFTGLSAFPLTPLADERVDERAFAGLVERIADSGIDTITALGSTGAYAYLDAGERERVVALAVRHAGDTPVFAGIGALRASHVLDNARAAEQAGAQGLLLAPMSYLPLTDDEVFELYRAATEHTDLPVILYDNPGTTHFDFTTELYGRIARLEGVVAIKIPAVPLEPRAAAARLASIRAAVPERIRIGVSGDASASAGLSAGCDAWYSVIAGIAPEPAVRITRLARSGRAAEADAESARLEPLWRLFAEFGGSLRVVAAIAEMLGLAEPDCLPLPIRGLDADGRRRVADVVHELGLDG